MKKLAKSLLVAKIKAREKVKPHVWGGKAKGLWDRKKADGGEVAKPAFDPSQPFEAAPDANAKPAFDPSQPFEAADTPSMLQSAVRGVGKGLSLGFSDELRAIDEVGGAKQGEPGSLVNTATGLYKYWSGDKDAEKTYDEAVARERAKDESYQSAHPYASMAGEAAGSLALPVGAGATAATLPARMARGAITGAGVGAAYGAGNGETPMERATGAATGAVLGGATGGLAPPLVEGAIQGVNAAARPVINSARGAFNPEGEASRRVVTALNRDFQNEGPQFTPEETAVARAANSPTAVIDAGGETTRALARSAANTSPEAREELAGLVHDRFGTQNTRTADFVQRLTGATGDNPSTTEALQAQARRANRPAYERAYQDGPVVWNPDIEQVTQAPAVQDAIRKATRSGANRAAADGFQPVRNPFEFDDTGHMSLRTNPDGSQAMPSLQFWDHVKRNLDDQVNTLQRSGENSAARDVNDLRRQLVGHLDNEVPSYQAARAGAAQAFGAQDALEAGSNFVTSKMDNAEARRAVQRMSPAERQLFQQGYASTLINKVNEVGDRRTVLNTIAQSPADRERLEIALGPQRARQLEAFLRVEGIMDRARTAITGNSTTARQLAELGLAGGAYGIAGHGDLTDPRAVATGALVWGLTHGHNRINENVARRVGEMLASNDPNVLQRGVQIIARHGNLFNNLRAMDGIGSKSGAGAASKGIQTLQGPIPARADDKKKKPAGTGN